MLCELGGGHTQKSAGAPTPCRPWAEEGRAGRTDPAAAPRRPGGAHPARPAPAARGHRSAPRPPCKTAVTGASQGMCVSPESPPRPVPAHKGDVAVLALGHAVQGARGVPEGRLVEPAGHVGGVAAVCLQGDGDVVAVVAPPPLVSPPPYSRWSGWTWWPARGRGRGHGRSWSAGSAAPPCSAPRRRGR